MKENFIHVCFIIDESGSMASSTNDVIAGFDKVINEHKGKNEGKCAVSLYKFNGSVNKVFVGADVDNVLPLNSVDARRWTSEIENSGWDSALSTLSNWVTSNVVFEPGKGLRMVDSEAKRPSVEETSARAQTDTRPNACATYFPNGMTAMYDGIGTAIDEIGAWLSAMDESERPSKNLIVIMTDGEENSSREYSEEKVREMIKHQEEKYNWTFMYMGTDITTSEHAERIGVSLTSYNTREDLRKSWDLVSAACMNYRTDASTFRKNIDTAVKSMKATYAAKTGYDLD